METQSPFSWWVQQAQALASRIQPPAWLIDEGQQRVVLLINHVLMQEPQACERLRRVAGQRVEVRWRQFNFCVVFTPAGLIERPSRFKNRIWFWKSPSPHPGHWRKLWPVGKSPRSTSKAMCNSPPKSTG